MPAPALTALRRGNLRPRLDCFVGRQDELRRPERGRLVTLVGPGGVGKTRLAVEAAGFDAAAWPDETWLVELAAVNDAGALAGAVSAALGVADTPVARGRPTAPEDVIAAHIGGRTMLVVLDNCEHLTEAVAQLAERLLALRARFHILATSREQLFVPGEVPFHVDPLPNADAVALFEDRARAARPDVDLVSSEAMVAGICGRLDGLPLAVELAAARVRALSPAELAARLDDRFRILAGGNRTAVPRHQTLRATISWRPPACAPGKPARCSPRWRSRPSCSPTTTSRGRQRCGPGWWPRRSRARIGSRGRACRAGSRGPLRR